MDLRYLNSIFPKVECECFVLFEKYIFVFYIHLQDTLESFAPRTQPRIPPIIVQCVNEIEKRGLEEVCYSQSGILFIQMFYICLVINISLTSSSLYCRKASTVFPGVNVW